MRRFTTVHCVFFLDAIASPSSYPCQSVSQSLIVSDLEIAIVSPSFASLFCMIWFCIIIFKPPEHRKHHLNSKWGEWISAPFISIHLSTCHIQSSIINPIRPIYDLLKRDPVELPLKELDPLHNIDFASNKVSLPCQRQLCVLSALQKMQKTLTNKTIASTQVFLSPCISSFSVFCPCDHHHFLIHLTHAHTRWTSALDGVKSHQAANQGTNVQGDSRSRIPW